MSTLWGPNQFFTWIIGLIVALVIADKNAPEKAAKALAEELAAAKASLAEEAEAGQTDPPKTQESPSVLIEYKKLLDEGIITQEEFDAKKAQILGL